MPCALLSSSRWMSSGDQLRRVATGIDRMSSSFAF
jgi:hypothetical protein